MPHINSNINLGSYNIKNIFMTIDELKDKQERITHSIYKGQMRSYTNSQLTNLSIQYALEELQHVFNYCVAGSEIESIVGEKIEDLKKNLNP